jgi:hypothetical protein
MLFKALFYYVSLVNGCSFFHIFQIRKTGNKNQGAFANKTNGRFLAGVIPHISSLQIIKTLVNNMDITMKVGIRIHSFPFINA